MAATSQEATTIMVVNDSDTAQSLTIRLPDAGKKTLTSYHYFAADRPHDRDGYPVPKERLADADFDRGVKLDLPTRGAIFLTTESSR